MKYLLIFVFALILVSCKKHNEVPLPILTDSDLSGRWFLENVAIYSFDTSTNKTSVVYGSQQQDPSAIIFYPDSTGRVFAQYGILSAYLPSFGQWYYDQELQLVYFVCSSCDPSKQNVAIVSDFRRSNQGTFFNLQITEHILNGKITTIIAGCFHE